jgi:phosphate transport system substrate-binding protein
MPHLLLHPHSRSPRRLVVVSVAAALLATAAIALAGCTSAAPSTPEPSVAAASAVRITGAGSTFDAPFFSAAFAAYQQAHPGTAVSYAAVGSSAGITRFTAGQADFGATDVPASPADLAGASGTTVQVPVDLGAVAVAYNAITGGSGPIRLTGPVIARIFLGQITRWDDPAVQALNPGTQLPNAYITVVHRSDGSGTTYIFSNYLSAVSPAWASAVGTGRSLRWPVGYAADGNAGVAAAISRIPYSIGYTERSYVTGTALAWAAVQNQAGNYVQPTPAAITADAAGRPDITPGSFSIVNEPGSASYPICGYSWVLLSARQPSTAGGKALTALISWLTHAGQSYAADLGYVPLPAAVQQLATTTLARVTGPAGAPLTG